MKKKKNAFAKLWIPALCVLAAATSHVSAESAARDERPNIVVVLVDDLGYSDLGCYGSEIETPNIDRLAAGGLRFSQFYNTAKCHSSRVSLLSGLYCYQAGSSKLDRAVTIAEVLGGAGYFTAMTGKWHLNKEPTDRGFARYFGHLSGSTNFFVGDDTFRLNGKRWSDFDKDFYTTDANTDYAIRFVDESLEAKKPFFLYIAHNAPHYPLQAPEKDVRKYAGKYDGGWDKLRADRYRRQIEQGIIDKSTRLSPRPDYIPAWKKLTDDERRWESARMSVFAAMVDRVDQNLGRLVDHLKSRGAYENTIILFCSDNGACPFERTRGKNLDPWDPKSYWCYDVGWAHAGNTPFRWYKQNQHEGGISSPLIAHWPTGLTAKKGSVTHQPGHLIDIMATCLEATGAKYPEEFQGREIAKLRGKSLLPILRGEQREGHEWLYFQFSNNRAIRRGDWKLVSARGSPWELYNLAKDRTELDDLAAKKPELTKELSALWHRAAKNIDRAPKHQRGTVRKTFQSFPPGSMTQREAGPKGERKRGNKKKGQKKKRRARKAKEGKTTQTNLVRAEKVVDFNRDVRPILAAKCFACHGPDAKERKAKLRLDDRDVAIRRGAITPGKSSESELIARIFSTSADEVMPPPEAREGLSDKEKATLRRWIEGGAEYAQHWAFVPPVKSPLPEVANKSWTRGGIDRFVLERLEAEGLAPSPEADRYTLVRRVYLDLIGLPPTPEEADAFSHDEDPKAWENLVDRLLESKKYGERWARNWLDLARYSDTNGYEKDRPRSIWPYRDWVIRALNDDMPFDQFTVEQLAGDMLPNATLNQRIATGFHRNTMLNEEGGIDPLEFRFYAMVDRVATTGTVWLGMTTGCAQCHSHKYDPISQTDYYGMMALLNNADEPDLSVVDEELAKRREKINAEIEAHEAALTEKLPREQLEETFDAWVASKAPGATAWSHLRPEKHESNLPKLEVLEDDSVYSSGDVTKRDVFKLWFDLGAVKSLAGKKITALRLEALPDERLPAGGPGNAYYEGRKGDFFLSELAVTAGGEQVGFFGASHDYGKIAVGSGNANATNVYDGNGSTGWSTAHREGQAHQLVLNLATPVEAKGELVIEMLFERHFVASLGLFRFSASADDGTPKAKSQPVEIEAILAKERGKWSDAEHARLLRHWVRQAPELAEARKPIDALRKKLPRPPHTLVLRERPADNPRPTHRHHRGEYLSPREEVTPKLPALFGSLPEGSKADRLHFARWLVSRDNPLVGRVTVNRAWQAIFGIGLHETSGDFGTQSPPPSHPELLDWLAVSFMEGGWSIKKLHRRIVLSATYRQRSSVSPELHARDPQNRLLARGPRLRVDAEIVRDVLLSVSGLLAEKMYGPSVYPPQPGSVTALAYGSGRWTASKGDDRYRRSLYTFSKRTTPFAAFTTFDGPTGETCTARRNRSNTPLQALTLLNDEMFLEYSRALAKLAHEKHAKSAENCATEIFRRVLTRPPSADELAALLRFYERQTKRLTAGELDASAIVGSNDATAERAAWAMLARSLFNVDEAITKP